MKKTEYLVDSEWLSKQLNNPQVIIIDCRFQLADPHWGEAEYSKSHIPGSYYLDLNRDLSREVQRHGGRHPLPDINGLAEKFAELGMIKNETLVVAYDDSRFAFASRLWWLLRYLGHNSVVLLDGGWNDWLKHDFPVTNTITENRLGSFSPQANSDWLVDIDTVKTVQERDYSGQTKSAESPTQNYDEIVIVDSRDRDRYLGLREPIDPIAGSIPGAVNSPWKQVSDESGYLKPLAAQRQLWEDFKQAEEVIVYCGSGVTACVNLFSLTLAGLNNTKLYAGGWSDWCSYLQD